VVNNTGGPAFPAHFYDGRSTGMTLRDYFAAKVLPELYADYAREVREDGGQVDVGDPNDPGVSSELIALECYAIADAMLIAREQK
jgi:hypothetical protein